MELTVVGIVVIGAALLSAPLSARVAAALFGLTIPLSASAAAVLSWAGGATVLCAAVCATALVARESILGPARLGRAGPPGAAQTLLIGFVGVSILGAYALPRLFQGDTLIYALDRTVVGVAEGVVKFPLTALAPSAGNLTQSAYLALSAALFFAMAALAARDRKAIGWLLWAATASQTVFALADALGAGWLDHFRTATYAIAPAQAFSGFTRLIGGATEPAFFGTVSSALAIWHLWSWRRMGGAHRLLAAGAMAALSVGSLSSTALAVLGGGLVLHACLSLTHARDLGALVAACFARRRAGRAWRSALARPDGRGDQRRARRAVLRQAAKRIGARTHGLGRAGAAEFRGYAWPRRRARLRPRQRVGCGGAGPDRASGRGAGGGVSRRPVPCPRPARGRAAARRRARRTGGGDAVRLAR